MERLTPLDIFNKDFKYAFRGYDVDEVNEFLDLIIKNFEFILEENRELKERIRSLQEAAAGEFNRDADQTSLIRDMLRRIERLEERIYT